MTRRNMLVRRRQCIGTGERMSEGLGRMSVPLVGTWFALGGVYISHTRSRSIESALTSSPY